MGNIDDNGAADLVVSAGAIGSRTPWLRKTILYFGFAVIVIVILSLILLSPLLLHQIGNVRGIDWVKLGSVGQTYGAASAIVSTFALLGIAVSLVLQRYQARAERIRIVRERQTDLLHIVLEDPRIYAPVIGVGNAATTDDIRRFFFASMWMNYSRLGYEMGILTERMLRDEIFPAMFASEPAREWWSATSYSWSHFAVLSRRDRKFAQIANEEFDKAVKGVASPTTWTIDEASPNAERTRNSGLQNLAVGMVVGIAIGLSARSRMRAKVADRRKLSGS